MSNRQSDGQARAEELLASGRDFTDWEEEFLESITMWRGELTEAQEDKLREIEADL